MTRVRRGALGLFAGLGGALGVASIDCASPTQIVLDLRADPALCTRLRTGVAVTTRSAIDTDPLEAFDSACKSGDRVGSLTITPSGARDEWVGIRVVGAVGARSPDSCGRPAASGQSDWSDCILARRRVRFAPGKTVNLTVRLSEDCVSRYCGGDLECSVGSCVTQEDATNQDNGGGTEPGSSQGGARPSGDASTVDGGNPPNDAALPDASDAAQGPCALCKGTSCNAGTCVYDCNGPLACQNKELCAPGLNCVIKCSPGGSCSNARCTTGGTCTFECTGKPSQGGSPVCAGIECSAAQCNVTCRGAEDVCSNVKVSGATNHVECIPYKDDKASCDSVTCEGGICTRDCGQFTLGCGERTMCSGDCSEWETWQ